MTGPVVGLSTQDALSMVQPVLPVVISLCAWKFLGKIKLLDAM